MLDPTGRVVMLSGASRGIGLAIANCLYDKGYTLSLGVRKPGELAEVMGDKVGERLSVHAYDAGDAEAPKNWLAETLQQHRRLDALVNNAGIFHPTTIETEDETLYDAMWQVNVKGPLRLVRAAVPYLKASGSGRVINLASLSGKRVAGGSLGYSMSKFAVVALTQQIRFEFWDDGIRATAICPSFVASDMAAGITDMPREEMSQPEDLAEVVATALALPNHTAVSEIPINWRYEPNF